MFSGVSKEISGMKWVKMKSDDYNRIISKLTEALGQRFCVKKVFSCEFCKISKNNSSYRGHPVAASKLREMFL